MALASGKRSGRVPTRFCRGSRVERGAHRAGRSSTWASWVGARRSARSRVAIRPDFRQHGRSGSPKPGGYDTVPQRRTADHHRRGGRARHRESSGGVFLSRRRQTPEARIVMLHSTACDHWYIGAKEDEREFHIDGARRSAHGGALRLPGDRGAGGLSRARHDVSNAGGPRRQPGRPA